MGLSIHGLRVYLCILECGSLSAAGRELGMTQPAISNHLPALEERFGVALLARGRPLRATPAGECLAGHARRPLDVVSALEDALARHARRPRTGGGASPGPRGGFWMLSPPLRPRWPATPPRTVRWWSARPRPRGSS